MTRTPDVTPRNSSSDSSSSDSPNSDASASVDHHSHGPVPQPGAGQALAVAGLLVAVMAGASIPNALWSGFQDSLGISTTVVTLVFASYAVAVVASLLLFGAWSDRFGRRPVLAVAATLAAAASLVSLGDHLGTLVLGRVLAGISVGLVSGAAAAYLIELVPASERRRGPLLAAAATMGGLATGPLLAAAADGLGLAGVRAPFVIHLVLLVPTLIALRNPETVTVSAQGARAGGRQRLSLPADRPRFLAAATAGFSANAQLGLYSALAPTMLSQSLDQDGIIIVSVTGALLFGAAGASQIAASGVLPAKVMRAGMSLLAVSSTALVAATVTGWLPLFLLATALGGTAGGLGFHGGLAVAGSLADDTKRGAVTSAWFVATYSGLVFPVVGAGYLVDALGVTATALIFGGALTLIGAAVASSSRQ